jgi:hypothetical protein
MRLISFGQQDLYKQPCALNHLLGDAALQIQHRGTLGLKLRLRVRNRSENRIDLLQNWTRFSAGTSGCSHGELLPKVAIYPCIRHGLSYEETLNLDDTVMRQLKREATRQGRTLSELVETALRLLFRSQKKTPDLPPLPNFHGGGALVDIADAILNLTGSRFSKW